MKKILLSSFSCNPSKGSESANGWNCSVGLTNQGFEVHTLTRIINKEDIEKHSAVDYLYFHYISLSYGLERLYSFSNLTMYLYYMLWQWKAFRLGKKLNNTKNFYRVHHITWGSIQQGSFLYKLNVPFIFGPAGGGQKAPKSFRKYFLDHWSSEKKRNLISKLLFNFNPACKKMLRKASVVLVSNRDTEVLAQKAGARNVVLMLDTALSKDFFPKKFIVRNPSINQIKLLWVGRMLPRKGILLILDVMNELRAYKDITLSILGDGEMNLIAKRRSKELNLDSTVQFIGAVPFYEVRTYYETHDLFFFTSLRESGGIQLIEAMAYNLPVVTIDLHGQGQIVNNETGIKIPLHEPKQVVKDLAAAIIALANDPVRYASMSRAAYEFSRKQIWDLKIKEIVEKYY